MGGTIEMMVRRIRKEDCDEKEQEQVSWEGREKNGERGPARNGTGTRSFLPSIQRNQQRTNDDEAHGTNTQIITSNERMEISVVTAATIR